MVYVFDGRDGGSDPRFSHAPTSLDEGDKANPNWREESGVIRDDKRAFPSLVTVGWSRPPHLRHTKTLTPNRKGKLHRPASYRFALCNGKEPGA